jgi:LPS-assembly lipoprotein
MSSSSAVQPSPRFRLALAGLLACGLAVAGCTVQPLYGTPPGATSSPGQMLSFVGVDPVDNRVDQEVRNQLLFLMHGGAAEPASPRYSVRLDIRQRRSDATTVPVGPDEDSPTSAIVALDAAYDIVDTSTGEPVAAGRRTISSAFDVPRQEFAALRAARDAENRAAREIAELLRLAIAQDLARI